MKSLAAEPFKYILYEDDTGRLFIEVYIDKGHFGESVQVWLLDVDVQKFREIGKEHAELIYQKIRFSAYEGEHKF